MNAIKLEKKQTNEKLGKTQYTSLGTNVVTSSYTFKVDSSWIGVWTWKNNCINIVLLDQNQIFELDKIQ